MTAAGAASISCTTELMRVERMHLVVDSSRACGEDQGEHLQARGVLEDPAHGGDGSGAIFVARELPR